MTHSCMYVATLSMFNTLHLLRKCNSLTWKFSLLFDLQNQKHWSSADSVENISDDYLWVRTRYELDVLSSVLLWFCYHREHRERHMRRIAHYSVVVYLKLLHISWRLQIFWKNLGEINPYVHHICPYTNIYIHIWTARMSKKC